MDTILRSRRVRGDAWRAACQSRSSPQRRRVARHGRGGRDTDSRGAAPPPSARLARDQSRRSRLGRHRPRRARPRQSRHRNKVGRGQLVWRRFSLSDRRCGETAAERQRFGPPPEGLDDYGSTRLPATRSRGATSTPRSTPPARSSSAASPTSSPRCADGQAMTMDARVTRPAFWSSKASLIASSG